MGNITGGIAARLRAEVSLVRLVEGCGVSLAKGGKAGGLSGDCLFCGAAGALVVEPEVNTWACGGCGLGGSVVEWVQHGEGVSFTHAVELLRQGAAITASGARGGRKPPKVTTRSLLPTAFDAGLPDGVLLGQVLDFYHRTLRERWEPGEYLQRRALGSSEMVKTFGLGFSARNLGFHLPDTRRVLGAQLRGQLQAIGVLKDNGRELFQGSIIFPVVDEHGTVVHAYGRKLGAKLRAGTRMHSWLPGDRPLFNAAALSSSREIVVCGSVIDTLSLWCAGHRHAVGVAGVDGFADAHLEAFLERDVSRVLIAFRRDDPGDLAAAALAAKLSPVGIECLRVELPNGQDVNDVAVASGPDGLAAALRGAAWMSGKATKATKTSRRAVAAKSTTRPVASVTAEPDAVDEPAHDVAGDAAGDLPAAESAVVVEDLADVSDPVAVVSASPVPLVPAGEVPVFSDDGADMWLRFGERRWRLRNLGRNTSFDVLRALLLVSVDGARGAGFHVDSIDLYSARARAGFCKEASIEVGVEEKVLKGDIAKVFGVAEAFVEEAIRRAQEPPDPTPTLDADERAAAFDLLRDPNLVDRITTDFGRAGMVGEATNCLVGYLAATSRLLDRPLAVVVQSTSAAGKSALMDAVLDFVPDEARVSFSAMTGQSLYYMGEHDLAHKVLSIAEEEGAERASYPLKLLQSEGELSIASTGKDTSTGRLVAHPYRVKGPAAIFLTTTAIDIDEELLNRCIVLTVDEDRAQTRAIHDRQRAAHTLDGMLAVNTRDGVLKVHRDAQRLLEPLAVVNPFAGRLGFVDTATRTRRDHVKYLTLISTIALLHQHQRERRTATNADGVEFAYIEVTVADIALANRLAHEVLGRSLDELPPQTRRVLGIVDTMVAEQAEAREIGRDKVRFGRREVRAASGLSDVQCRKHLDRLVDLEYLWVHRGERGAAYVYELVFTGDIADPTPRMAGLVDADTLVADATGDPSSPPCDGGFAPRTLPVRPPNAPASPPTGNGARPAPTRPEEAGDTKTVLEAAPETVSYPHDVTAASAGSSGSKKAAG